MKNVEKIIDGLDGWKRNLVRTSIKVDKTHSIKVEHITEGETLLFSENSKSNLVNILSEILIPTLADT